MAAGDRRMLYQQVADDLERRIRTGEYGPGAKLPSESELRTRYRASSTTVRSAVRSLASAGLVVTRQGAGTHVVEPRILTLHATLTEDLDLRTTATAQDAWASEVTAAGRVPSQKFECLLVAASAEDAEVLNVEVGSSLVMRRCWRSVDDQPASIESSLYPRWLVDEVPDLASPTDIAIGTTLLLAQQGFPVSWHRDTVRARAATPDEGAWLGAIPGTPVLDRRRTSWSEGNGPGGRGRIIRTTVTVYRSDVHDLAYEIRGRGNGQ